jgi:CelD/BcsL family acetyltransferase involved in cellulose biosynthesis
LKTVEVITTRAAFRRLEPAWNALLCESASNTVSLTWEWMNAWWEVFGGEGRELYVVVIRSGEEVIGIAPLHRRRLFHYGLLPFRRLQFLASSEDEADATCSEYLDFILRRGREAEALGILLEHLRARAEDWDEVLLSNMAEDSPNVTFLLSLCRSKPLAASVVRRDEGCYLPLAGDYETKLATLGSKFRSNLRRDQRAVGRGAAALSVVEGAEEFAAGFEQLVELHQNLWRSRGHSGAFASEKFTRFHRLLARALQGRGWVKLFTLSVAGETVAALYAFTYGGKMLYYQSGIAHESGPVSSPGTLVQSFAIKEACRAGLTEFDFLGGGADGYKSRWAPSRRGFLWLRLARTQPKEVAYRAATSFVGGLRKVKRSLPRAKPRGLEARGPMP